MAALSPGSAGLIVRQQLLIGWPGTSRNQKVTMSADESEFNCSVAEGIVAKKESILESDSDYCTTSQLLTDLFRKLQSTFLAMANNYLHLYLEVNDCVITGKQTDYSNLVVFT